MAFKQAFFAEKHSFLLFGSVHIILGKQTSMTNYISEFTNMARSKDGSKPLRVAFCHPDLGLGGKLAD
jgi:hypothetical protein